VNAPTEPAFREPLTPRSRCTVELLTLEPFCASVCRRTTANNSWEFSAPQKVGTQAVQYLASLRQTPVDTRIRAGAFSYVCVDGPCAPCICCYHGNPAVAMCNCAEHSEPEQMQAPFTPYLQHVHGNPLRPGALFSVRQRYHCSAFSAITSWYLEAPTLAAMIRLTRRCLKRTTFLLPICQC
jgi:hypothetical protein